MDEIQAAVKTCFNKYTEFTGRAARPEFWWFFLFQVVVLVVASMIHGVVYIVAALALLLPGIAVGIRRLHDTGKTGWLMLIALIPVIGGLVLLFFMAQPGEAQDNQYGPAAAAPPAELAPGQS